MLQSKVLAVTYYRTRALRLKGDFQYTQKKFGVKLYTFLF
jgi:hypothetical protein